MLLTRSALAQVPLAWLPPALGHSRPSNLSRLAALARRPDTYLLVATPYDRTATVRTPAPILPLARAPLAVPPYVTMAGGERPVHLSNVNYLSGATDSPAHQPFPGRLAVAYALSASLGGGSDPLPPIAATRLSDVEIRNADGAYDTLLDMAWSGREVRVLAGMLDWPLAHFAPLLRGVVTGIRVSEQAINLTLETRAAVLSEPVERVLYLGTGGAQGPAALKDTPVPLALGRVRSAQMTLMDEARQIYRVAERLSAVLAVREMGLVLPASVGDCPDHAVLAAATVPAGRYATCLALGLIRFGSSVVVPVADIEGEPDAGLTAGAIVRWLLAERAPLKLRTGVADLDLGALAALDQLRPWPVGILLTDATTLADAAAPLLRSVGGWIAATRAGTLTAGAYALPSEAEMVVTAAMVDDSRRIASAGYVLPPSEVAVSYRPLGRTLSDGEMPAASAADKAALGGERPVVRAYRASPERSAAAVRIDSRLDDPAHAQALADLAAALLGTLTRRWTVPLRAPSWPYRVGMTIRPEYPRYGLDAGRTYVVTGVTESADGADDALEIWGSP
jgi:hypothetical protein